MTRTDPAIVVVLAVLALLFLLVSGILEALYDRHPGFHRWVDEIVDRILR